MKSTLVVLLFILCTYKTSSTSLYKTQSSPDFEAFQRRFDEFEDLTVNCGTFLCLKRKLI